MEILGIRKGVLRKMGIFQGKAAFMKQDEELW